MDRLTFTLREAFRSINRLPRLAIAGILVVIVLAFLVLAGLFVYLPYDLAMNGPKADAIQKDIENELKQIAPPPNSLSIRYGSMHKTHQGDVGSDYRSSNNYGELRLHYDSELSRHGWKFVKEEPVKIWGKDHAKDRAVARSFALCCVSCSLLIY